MFIGDIVSRRISTSISYKLEDIAKVQLGPFQTIIRSNFPDLREKTKGFNWSMGSEAKGHI